MEGMIPVIIDGQFCDGALISAMPRCNEKFCQGACKKFYEKISELEDGYYQCPSGYTVYKRKKDEKSFFYCGMRIKGYYDKKKSKEHPVDLPIIGSSFFERILDQDDELRSIRHALDFEREIHKDLLHDIRKLDGLIKNKSEEIIAQYQDCTDEGMYEVTQKVRNIGAMEELISCKYATYDLVSNIQLLAMGNKTSVSVYRKFDKIRYILLNYKNKGTKIDFVGETDFLYKANLSYFEVLPFLLMENAVKYSKEGHSVSVKFEEQGSCLNVLIESYGPYCSKEEVPHLFDKNYRGGMAKAVTGEGTGIGLYLAREICKQHGIEIYIDTEYKKRNNGIHYGYFRVHLKF
ncbi:MAG: sensor histidine kinase [Acetatifactor sp.]